MHASVHSRYLLYPISNQISSKTAYKGTCKHQQPSTNNAQSDIIDALSVIIIRGPFTKPKARTSTRKLSPTLWDI